MRKDAKYWRTVRSKAKKLKSDGCTGVPDFYLECCLEHDIHYRTHKKMDGTRITKAQADKTLKECIQSRSIFGRYSPMAWWRYRFMVWSKQVQKAWDH